MRWFLKQWFGGCLIIVLACGLSACNPNTQLTKDNLLRGARAETFVLNHAALCAPLPSVQAIDGYARGVIPERSSVGRLVHAWDMSGLLNIVQSGDGGWVVLPSAGLKQLGKVHFRQNASGEDDALCFGKVWVESVEGYEENQPLGVQGAVTAKVRLVLKDSGMLRHFRGLKLEAYDPAIFTLEHGTAYAEDLKDGFTVNMALRPTDVGWFFASNTAQP